MVTCSRSLRQVEERTGQIAKKHGGWMGIVGRIADNTLGRVLPRLRFVEMMSCLHRLIKREYRRGNLRPTFLPLGAVAIDGKNIATLRWHDMCRVLELEESEAAPEQVKTLFAERFGDAQVCIPTSGRPYALVRVHTVTLISSGASVCIHLRPTLGHTNELGSMPALLRELKAAYGRTRLFELVTTDAGNTSLAVASLSVALGWHYFAQIKSVQGAIFEEAERALGNRPDEDADASYVDTQNGQIISYHLWRCDLSDAGWLQWTHARQLIRVRRTAEDPKTEVSSVGNRYYVTSKSPDALAARSALKISRAHWRCENCTHWTADAELQEDRRRLAWSRHPIGVLIVSALRMMALAILSVARLLTRLEYSLERPTWAQVSGHFLLELCDSILDTEAFDNV